MKKILAAAAGVLFALTAAVGAAEPVESPAALKLEGMAELAVTSSVNSADIDSSVFFDRLVETGVAVTASENGAAFSVYTASRVPEAITAYAAILSGEKGSAVAVAAYGTNDSSLENWATVIPAGAAYEKDGFRVFPVEESLVKYAFYRFDFTVVEGGGFTLAELALFTADRGEPILVYAPADAVEVGETLPLVPAAEYTVEIVSFPQTEGKTKWEPSFGLGLRPGLRK